MSESSFPQPVHPAIDWLKACAIVAVVVAHSGPFAFSPLTAGDRLIRVTLATFHVPVFLLVSGYLHARPARLTVAQIGRRLRRILWPYLIASVVVTALGLDRFATWSLLPRNLMMGSALPIYYYVLVWTFCVLTGWIWSRCSAGALVGALGVVVLATEARGLWSPPIGFVWALRDPLLQGWLLYYLLGWCARRFAWDEYMARHRSSLLLALALCLPWVWRDGSPGWLRIPYGIGIAWGALALVTRPAPALIRWMGRETLWVYLAHIPIVAVLRPLAEGWSTGPRIAFVTGVTLAITLGSIALVRRLQDLISRS